jgi:hypothetical protein
MAAVPDPKDHSELVDVFDTQQESEAMVVQGLLESNGIESVLSSLDAPQDVLPGVGGMVIRVSPQFANEARALIEDYRNNPGSEDDAESSST